MYIRAPKTAFLEKIAQWSNRWCEDEQCLIWILCHLSDRTKWLHLSLTFDFIFYLRLSNEEHASVASVLCTPCTFMDRDIAIGYWNMASVIMKPLSPWKMFSRFKPNQQFLPLLTRWAGWRMVSQYIRRIAISDHNSEASTMERSAGILIPHKNGQLEKFGH